MSHVSLQDSINPKPQSEGIVEEHPRQLAPSVGTLLAQDPSSADPTMSSTASSTPSSSSSPILGSPIRFGSYEFTPHSDSSRSTFSGLRGNMEMAFGSVNYNVNAEGILRLLEPRAPRSARKPLLSAAGPIMSSIDLSAGLTDSSGPSAPSTPRSASSMSVGSDNPAPSEMTSYYCLNCDTRHGLGSSDTPFICSAQYSSGEDSVDSIAKKAAGGTFMSITLEAATKLLDDMMINYSEWHTERAPQGKKVNYVEETSSLSDKIDVIMSMLVNVRSNVDPNNVPLASLVAQEENVDVNFIKNNNFNNNAYRNNSGNNYRPYPSANGNGYSNSYGNSYNNNRSVPSGLEAMLKEFSTQTAFNKSVEEKLDKIDIIASRVDRLASDVNLLNLKVMPNNDIDNKITTTANAIQMNRQWMYGNRLSGEFSTGLNDFLVVANANKQGGFVICPCVKCKNQKGYSSSRDVQLHLLRHGFMPSYNCWTKHEERGVIMEEDEEGDDFIDESYLAHFGDTFMEDAEGEGEGEGEGEEEARDDPVDDLGRTIADARRRCETEKERENLDRMLEDHRKALYPGCDDGLKKLGCTLDLLKWKAQAGVADSAFEDLLKMLKNMFPKNNELPTSTYEAKKVVCPLGLEVLKIHACINDCILYRGEYENLNECPVCTALRYKIRGDDPGDDVEGQKPRKKVPAKVMWYAPIIPRLKRLFRTKSMPSCCDGTKRTSSSHSTWPVTLCIYNLPPWLCMKRKFIMMPVLIQGPKQPGNDIDVYLRPLVDELLQLWGRPGVRVWDEHKEEEFDLRALLFVTINDWPALSNLSGLSNKGYNACTHCLHETQSVHLPNCKKNVYLGHRRFLPKGHPVRKKGKHYNGKADHRPKPAEHTGAEVFDMVKDLKVIFGKGPGGQSVPKGADGHVAMWKKKSIFWELEYWKVLEVRSAIDVMHVTKNICVNILSFLGVYGKSNDTKEARQDQQSLKDPDDLYPERFQGRASYALTKEEKVIFFECLSSMKVPSGFSSNIKGIINMAEKKFQNLKSHDCHVIMTQLLPLRGLLPENVRVAIVKLCAFLNAISQKVINPEVLPRLQNDVVQCLVSFELVFPAILLQYYDAPPGSPSR
ncbi:hypothetical protein QYE76_012997 [Lolium multiflorum]|uniref:Transposase-associated domain-containing protein n=1 Tax=Lolium multiflorum TaxID=4521 RepID=A0AAD8U270_LOLMU|nr:hypothetical protein QYE76_012997 [Lolium multiflorum]